MQTKVKLFEEKPKRLFVFGCSFTEYTWMTWANILALDLDIPFFNYAVSGAGNRFIATRLVHADAFHKFTKNDLVIVCWTNIARIDRYISAEERWVLQGNIYNNVNYKLKELKKIDQTDLFLRDMAYIRLSHEMLKSKTNAHFLQMLDISKWFDQQHESIFPNESQILSIDNDILNLYQDTLQEMQKSFYDVLWNDTLTFKLNWNRKTIHKLFWDSHPLPGEHYKYLTQTFDHKMKDKTVDRVKNIHEKTIEYIKKYIEQDPAALQDRLCNHQREIIGPRGTSMEEVV